MKKWPPSGPTGEQEQAMDEGDVSDNPGHQEPPTRSRLGAPLLRFFSQHAPLLPRLSGWSLHALQWQRPVRQAIADTRTTWRRIHPALKFIYYVLPAPLLRPRVVGRSLTRPAMARARIIANPMSGSLHGELGLQELEETAAWLSERGLPTELCLTEHSGHAQELAQEAVAAGMEMVVAAGGDGTVNEVVQALAGQMTALGVLPMGTVNVWAREMGIPLRTAQARELLLRGMRRRVDLGRANSHYFLLMAGIGFDAEVLRRVEKRLLQRWGLKVVDYAATAGFLSVTLPVSKIWMRSDGRRRSADALMVLIGNTRLYGGAFRFAKEAVADDGLLDVVIVGGGSAIGRLGVLARALVRKASLGPRVRYHRCRTIRLEAGVPLPVQVDGEVIGTLPMTFSVAPGALDVIVPAHAPAKLFVHEPVHSA